MLFSLPFFSRHEDMHSILYPHYHPSDLALGFRPRPRIVDQDWFFQPHLSGPPEYPVQRRVGPHHDVRRTLLRETESWKKYARPTSSGRPITTPQEISGDRTEIKVSGSVGDESESSLEPIPVELLNTESENENSQENLTKRLELYGFREKTKIRGDGNCQFASCADQLFNDPEKHMVVRQAAVDWLRKNPHYKLPNQTTIGDYLQTEFFPEWDDYCDYVAQETIWGDHLTLLAIAEVYRTKIVVVTSMEVQPGIDPFTVIIPKQVDPGKVIYLSHLHELHYSSLIQEEEG